MTVQWNDQLAAKVEQAAFRGVVIGVEMVRTEANRSIRQGPKTGKIYRRRGIEHQASAPGEPPASDTGRLIKSSRTETNRQLLSGTAIWSTAYARPLEEGTNTIEPRPYARPALTTTLPRIVRAISDEIEAVL